MTQAKKKDVNTDLAQAEDYLNIGLTLADEINPARYLAIGGIVPSDTTQYKISQIQEVLGKKVKGEGNFYMNCIQGKDEKQYLQEVRFCLDLNYKLISCSKMTISSCTHGDSVFYLP